VPTAQDLLYLQAFYKQVQKVPECAPFEN